MNDFNKTTNDVFICMLFRLRSVRLTMMMILFDFLYNSFHVTTQIHTSYMYNTKHRWNLNYSRFSTKQTENTHIFTHTRSHSHCVDKNAFWRLLFFFTPISFVLTSSLARARGENGVVCLCVYLFAHAVR